LNYAREYVIKITKKALKYSTKIKGRKMGENGRYAYENMHYGKKLYYNINNIVKND